MATKVHETTASASWMEHQILQHVKDALRVTVQWDAPSVSVPRKLSSVRFTLKSFKRHLERLMALEEEGGYLSALTEQRPQLESKVAQLAGDHDRFRARIKQIVPRIEALDEWQEADFDQICQEICALLDDIDKHDSREIELWQQLCNEEGGEG